MLPSWRRGLIVVVLARGSWSLVTQPCTGVLLQLTVLTVLFYILRVFLVNGAFILVLHFFLIVIRMLHVGGWSPQRDSGLLAWRYFVFCFFLSLKLMESEITLLFALHKTYYWLSIVTNYNSLLWSDRLAQSLVGYFLQHSFRLAPLLRVAALDASRIAIGCGLVLGCGGILHSDWTILILFFDAFNGFRSWVRNFNRLVVGQLPPILFCCCLGPDLVELRVGSFRFVITSVHLAFHLTVMT